MVIQNSNFTLILILISFMNLCNAQTFLNGSFENITSSDDCYYNISNSTFNSMVSNVIAFGSYEAIDIKMLNCYIPNIPDGAFVISLANNPSNNFEGESIGIELSSSLNNGTEYTISFQGYSQPARPQGNLLIGCSEFGDDFGIEIYNATTVSGQWSSYTFSFIAPNNASYITVKPAAGISSWNSVDNFEIVETSLSIQGYENIKPIIKIYPNPANDFIKVSGLNKIENYRIYNTLGVEVNNGIISDNDKIEIKNYSNGLYFLKFENGNVFKFIKE